MAAPNRTSLTTKMYKVLKRHYKPVLTPERPLLETLLFAACLENAPYDAAEKAYAALSAGFFDWNEVRVTTVKELSEAMAMVPHAEEAAQRVKSLLQGVFEATYSFELESLHKLNLGQAQQKLAKFDGATPFVIAVGTQLSLGGHAIPIDKALMEAFAIVGIVSAAERDAGTLPTLEKAIPKNKGIEFGSLAHQFAADLAANPYSPTLHKILLEMAPDAKDRLPKRPPKGAKPPEPPPPPATRPKSGKVEAPPAAQSGKAPTAAPGKALAQAPSSKTPTPSEAGKKEPPKSEAAKKEPSKAEPPRKEPARPEAAKKAPPQPAPAKAAPTKAQPAKAAKPAKPAGKPAALAAQKKPPARPAPRKPR